ncbi:MAG: hypothetical protein L0Z62_31190 [Gemmataceae bacterium]|nr:hypothetical protein [Gemmataceae bacterium]
MTDNGDIPARQRLWQTTLFCLVFSVALVGCGGAGNLAPVSGTLKYKGEPVKGGTLMFSPTGEGGQTGKPTSASVKEDGAFKTGEGALVGRHRVTYTPPEQKLTEEQRTNPKYIAPPPPYMNLVAKPAEVEVKSGDNTITLELVPRGFK